MSGARSILVCFAVKEEAKSFLPFATTTAGVRVLLTGMGRRNAERSVRAAIQSARPDLVLSAGFAGGLRPGLPAGAVIYDLDAAGDLGSVLADAGAQPGRFHCAERVASTAAEKRSLWRSTGADAVEMESQEICSACAEQQVASATVRVVLDPAEVDLPLDFNRLMTADLRLDPAKLALQLAKSPAKIPSLLRLRSQSDAAATKLAEVLCRVVDTVLKPSD